MRILLLSRMYGPSLLTKNLKLLKSNEKPPTDDYFFSAKSSPARRDPAKQQATIISALCTIPSNPRRSSHPSTTTMSNSRIEYSEKYADEENEYRHVILPKELAKTLPKTRLLTENEWRSIGVQQSRGWQHYAIHRPEPHILLFRRPLGTDPQTGQIDPELKRLALEEYTGQFGLRGN